jgi:uncharacterized protein DUF1800
VGRDEASRHDVARLFGRAAFGATAADLDTWSGKPYEDIVSFLVDIPGVDDRLPAFDDARRVFLDQTFGLDAGIGFFPLDQAQFWWLDRMRTTEYPFEERMTLFWHDHFATGPSDKGASVGSLVAQNQTLRRNALGNFRTMCEEITLDPAMLFWLDGAVNSAFARNENYAREFFELFTLGVLPQVYTEKDIRQSAMALTGWHTDPFTRLVFFDPGTHHAGKKVVLGRTITDKGDQEYKEIVDIALDQEVSPYFVAYKMVLNFAYVPATRNVLKDHDPLIDKIAHTLRRTKWDLREAARTMLLADEFRHTRAGLIVRQPIELVVHATKALGVGAEDGAAVQILGRMGQLPFKPPNVGGWPFGRDWLSPATFLARYDWGLLAHQLFNNGGFFAEPLPQPKDLKTWVARFGLAGLTRNTASALQSYLSSRLGAPAAELQAGLIALIVSSPDWMVM